MQSADGGGTNSGSSSAPKGGQFALGGGHVAASAQKQKAKRRRKLPARPASLGFDGQRGAGYGVKGGDPRVRSLQSVLKRFGLKDADGRALVIDGKFGPRTTAAVKQLQKAMGLAATGKVDEAFIKRVSGAHSLADLKPKKAVSKVRRAMTKPYGDVQYADPGYQEDGKERYPLDSEVHCRAAWSYINQADNAEQYTPEQLAKVKGRIKAALRRYDVGDSARSKLLAGLIARSGPGTYNRCFALDDIQISRSGDGRTVEAYAAIFDQPYEVRDEHGHYLERIERSAFNRTLNGAGKNALCLYNHGMTVHGTPDGMASLPLGNPLEIRPDGRGLLTVTRYNKGPWADSVLESIRNGDIKAQSFRGRIVRSSPVGPVPRRRPGDHLPVVTRHELGLSDYGPTPTAVNDDAAIVAVRSAADILDAMQYLDADEREELLRALNLASTPYGDPDDEEDDPEGDEEEDGEDEDLEGENPEADPTSDQSEPGAEDPPAERSEHSGRLEQDRALLLLRAELKRRVRRG